MRTSLFPPRESSIEAKFARVARERGWLPVKLGTTIYTGSGWPDRLVIHRGQHVYIEFKRPGGKPTPLQAARHRELVGHGCRVAVCTSAEQALSVCAEAFGES